MNKLFILFFSAVLFAACSDSNSGGEDDSHTPDPLTAPGVNSTFAGNWADRNDPNYKGEKYNPLADIWQVKKINGQPYNGHMYFNFAIQRNFSVSTSEAKPGEDPGKWAASRKYGLNDHQFRTTENEKLYEYKLTASPTGDDKLEVYDGRDRFELEIHHTSLNLDNWNDPFDRHFSLFNGNYNPVEGTWKATHRNGTAMLESESFYYIFTEDFELIYKSNEIHTDSHGIYSINHSIIGNSRYNMRYEIINNILKTQIVYSLESSNETVFSFMKIE